MHAEVLAATEGSDVPQLPRKCIKPKERAPVPTNLFAPFACLEPVVNVSATLGNQAESFVVVNPTNTNNVVAFSNTNSASIFRAYSTDAGTTWTRGTVATGVACCDGQAVFDTFGNLFLVYLNNSVNQVNVILSTDGGVTFSAPVTAGTGPVDQPSIAVGNGSVWVDWNQGGSMVARGAPVTGLGVWGPFNAQQAIPSATGSFGGIAVGPGPNGGKVIVTYQSPTGGQGPATIYVNVDADGLGAGGFGPRITVTSTNVGGFDFIPAQMERSVDAEAGMVWDATGGPFNNRIYLVYTEEPVNESNDTEIYLRTSTDDGTTWTAPVRVNDDPLGPIRSQFLPYIALDPTTGIVAVGFHDCRNDDGVNGTNMIPNDDAEYYGTFTTDGGATWAPNRRLSGGFSNATASGNGIDYGDYVGLDALAGKLTHCGRTTRTAMARTRMARCTSLTCTRTHSRSRGELRRRHQRLQRRRLQPLHQRPQRPRLLRLHQRQRLRRGLFQHRGLTQRRRLGHNGKSPKKFLTREPARKNQAPCLGAWVARVRV